MVCTPCKILKVSVIGALILGFLPIWRHPDEPGAVTGFEAVRRSAFSTEPILIPIKKAREIASTAELKGVPMHHRRPFGRRSHILTDMAIRRA